MLFSSKSGLKYGIWMMVLGCGISTQVLANSVVGLDHRENSSILVNTALKNPMLDGHPIYDQLADAKYSDTMRRQFEEITRRHEDRQNHALVNHHQQKAYFEQVQGIAHVYLDHIRGEQSHLMGEKFKALAEKNPTVKTSMEIVVGALAIYSGKPMRFRPHSEVMVILSTHVANKAATLQITSPLGETRADFAPGPERSVFSYSKMLALFDLRGGVSYASSSKSTTASLSKELTPNLVASYNTRFNVESTYQFNYGIVF